MIMGEYVEIEDTTMLNEEGVVLDEESEATSFLRTYFDDDDYVARRGVDVSRFDLTSSSEKVRGANGVVIRNIPLSKSEAETLGLEVGQTIDLLVFDGTDTLKTVKFLSGVPDNSFWSDNQMYYDKLTQAVLGRDPMDYSTITEQMQRLRDAVGDGGRVLVVYGHGLEIEDDQKIKVVGNPRVTSEYLEYFLEALPVDGVVAVIDGTCTFPEGFVPKLPENFPTYFASLTDVRVRLNKVGTVVVENGLGKRYIPD